MSCLDIGTLFLQGYHYLDQHLQLAEILKALQTVSFTRMLKFPFTQYERVTTTCNKVRDEYGTSVSAAATSYATAITS